MRGMAGVEAAIMSGMGHMTSFCGSETIPAIAGLEEYYNEMLMKSLLQLQYQLLNIQLCVQEVRRMNWKHSED